MLSTGIKTPVGIKVGGPDLRDLQRIGKEVEAVVKGLPGTLSAYSELLVYPSIDFVWRPLGLRRTVLFPEGSGAGAGGAERSGE